MIRLATNEDYRRIAIALSHKEPLNYITKKHVREDIAQGACYVLEEDRKIVAICSLVYDDTFKYHYLKRLLILNKRNQSKGYATAILTKLAQKKEKIAITPFQTNKSMIRLVKKLGFTYRYNFLDEYCFYTKEGNE